MFEITNITNQYGKKRQIFSIGGYKLRPGATIIFPEIPKEALLYKEMGLVVIVKIPSVKSFEAEKAKDETETPENVDENPKNDKEPDGETLSEDETHAESESEGETHAESESEDETHTEPESEDEKPKESKSTGTGRRKRRNAS